MGIFSISCYQALSIINFFVSFLFCIRFSLDLVNFTYFFLGFSGAPEFVGSPTGLEKRDVDVISEAGTYIVGRV